MPRLSHVVSFALFGSAGLGLTACPTTDRVPNSDHCANLDGDASCIAWNVNLPFCGRGSCYPDARDGCVAELPEDPACYSPCGDGMCTGGTTLADSSTTGTSVGTSSVGSTTSATSGTSSTDDITGATTDAQTETSVSSSDATDSSTDESSTSGILPPVDCVEDSDCAVLDDPLRSICADEICTQCDNVDARGCDDPLAPLCSDNTCVPCTSDDLGACEGTDTPVCFDDACVPCSDDDPGICAEQDLVCSDQACVECVENTQCQDSRQSPVCDDDSNTCVACTADDPGACEGTSPICDPLAHACEPCTTHDACADLDPDFPGAACHLNTGACLAGGVWHVDADDPACSDDGPGTADEPLCELGIALDEADQAGEGTVILHERSDPPRYGVEATVSGDLAIAILGAEGETPRIRGTGGQAILVSNGATIYLHNIEFSDSTGVALRIDNANARVENSTVTDNNGVGIEAINGASVVLETVEVTSNQGIGIRATGGATLDIQTSRLARNVTHAIEVDGAQVSIINTFATHQQANATAVSVASGGTFESLYSSISAGLQNSAALQCEGGTIVDVRNSILVKDGPGNGQALDCVTATIDHSVLTGTFEGATNSYLQPLLDPYWFRYFSEGDLHLDFAFTGDFLDIAEWQTGDPLTDIDGDPRTTDGATDFPGADVPVEP